MATTTKCITCGRIDTGPGSALFGFLLGLAPLGAVAYLAPTIPTWLRAWCASSFLLMITITYITSMTRKNLTR